MKLPSYSSTIAALLAAALLAPAAFAGDTTPKPAAERDRVRDRRVFVAERGHGAHLHHLAAGRGYLGIVTTWLTPELRTHFGAPEDAGVLVGQVASGTPAEKAGLEVGDVIVAINGENVASAGDVMAEIRKLEAGDEARLDIIRDGRTQTLTATIEERERSQVDLGQMFQWKTDGDGPEMAWTPKMHGELLKTVPPDTFVNLGDSLKAVDWGLIAERAGRSTEDLERRLADLEKRLADLQKKLELATRDNR